MIKFKDIKNGVWISKESEYILGLETNQGTIKQVLYHIKQKKTKVIIYKNNALYQSDLKTIISDPKQQKAFETRTKKVFESNPYWSIVGVSPDIESSLNKECAGSAINEQLQEKIAKFAKIVCKSDTFAKTAFYKQSDICETIKGEVLARIEFGEAIVREQQDQLVTTEVSMDQFQTAINVSDASTKLDQSSGTGVMYDFSEVKKIYQDLIKEVGEGKPALKITSKNKQLDYQYTFFVDSKELIFKQSSDYSKKEYKLNFDEGTISINNQRSNDKQDKNKLRDIIKKTGLDLEKNLAAIEGVSSIEVSGR